MALVLSVPAPSPMLAGNLPEAKSPRLNQMSCEKLKQLLDAELISTKSIERDMEKNDRGITLLGNRIKDLNGQQVALDSKLAKTSDKAERRAIKSQQRKVKSQLRSHTRAMRNSTREARTLDRQHQKSADYASSLRHILKEKGCKTR